MIQQNHAIITLDPNMRKVLKVAENIAHSRASVLVTGESGTGKELLARYIHSKSPRALKRMVAINCAAVPEGLLESELFGHEKGSFTGAHQAKPGKFELAHQSTLLLDEMGELPLVLQSKLLRALQEGEIERVGGKEPIKVDVRIIVTTNKDLKKLVQEGLFREDLFYRLNVIPVHIPPLRARPKDLILLAKHFVEVSCITNGITPKELSQEAINSLLLSQWPGNIRELQNVVERTVLLSQNQMITEEDLNIQIETNKADVPFTPGMTLGDAEKFLILKTLEFTSQNRTQAAKILGISIRTLRNKLCEYRKDGEHEQTV
jgi:transcriptional regulator with PAS, ATPase and Fis domain